MTSNDRRTQPRVVWSGDAVAAFGAREVRLRTRDLSVGGCCVETPWCPATGERIGIVLQLDGAPIGAWAEVAWAAPRYGTPRASYVWGVRFLELEEDCRTRLEAFVDHCMAVEMLDEMLRGAPEGERPSFSAGELEDVPTRIFHHGHLGVSASRSRVAA
jgi:PilZ domain